MSTSSPGNDGIDRVAPTRRPAGRSLMHQRWAHLLFIHWIVPAEGLRRLLPPGLELDTFEGRAYVGLLPFTMTGVRPWYFPTIPGVSDFHEVNVRTYVHLGGRDPGVWFFSLDAANRLAVRMARWTYHLPYYYARMRLVEEGWPGRERSADEARAGDRPMVEYASERLWAEPLPAACHLRYGPAGEVAPARAGTLEHFLAERYILYSQANGTLYQGRVHHRPYPLQPGEVTWLDENLISAAGIVRPAEPPLVHYAREVDVEVFPLTKVAGRSSPLS